LTRSIAIADIDDVVARQGATPSSPARGLITSSPACRRCRPPSEPTIGRPRAAAQFVAVSNEQIEVTALGMSSPSVA
jgi:hypothetical protein